MCAVQETGSIGCRLSRGVSHHTSACSCAGNVQAAARCAGCGWRRCCSLRGGARATAFAVPNRLLRWEIPLGSARFGRRCLVDRAQLCSSHTLLPFFFPSQFPVWISASLMWRLLLLPRRNGNASPYPRRTYLCTCQSQTEIVCTLYLKIPATCSN